MKRLAAILILMSLQILAVAQVPSGIIQNSFNTNTDRVVYGIISSSLGSLLSNSIYGYSVSGCSVPSANGIYEPIIPAFNFGGNPLGGFTNGAYNVNGSGTFLGDSTLAFFGGSTLYQWGIFASITGAPIANQGGSTLYEPPVTNTWRYPYGTVVNYVYSGIAPYVNAANLSAAGGISSVNLAQYVDPLGSVSTNLTSTTSTNVATVGMLSVDTNSVATSFIAYSPIQSLYWSQVIYSNNYPGYLTPSATNGITLLSSNAVSQISVGAGLSKTSSTNQSGIAYSLTYTGGTNVVYVTNINSANLQIWGSFTTNQYSWASYLAPIGDWTNAYIYTNGIISSATAASTYQAAGSYLTPSSSLDYTKFTNAPVIPSTNGFVTQSITNGLATVAFVNNQLFVPLSSTNGLATTNYLNTQVALYITNQNLITASNTLQTLIALTSNTVPLKWGTNTAFVGSVVINTNLIASYTTNGGVITMTIGSVTNLYSLSGLQPASANLTNWSMIPTNVIVQNPVPVCFIQGRGTTVAYTTNSSGVAANVAVNSGDSFVQLASGNISGYLANNQDILFTSRNSFVHVSWPSTLPASPAHYKILSAATGADLSFYFTNISVTASGITAVGPYTSSGLSTNVYVIGAAY